MSHSNDFRIATSSQIETRLCSRLEAIRLSKNISQNELAENAGLSRRTISRMENGQGVSFDTFIRVMRALDLTDHLEALLPDHGILPIERVKERRRPRVRASRASKKENETKDKWVWGKP